MGKPEDAEAVVLETDGSLSVVQDAGSDSVMVLGNVRQDP